MDLLLSQRRLANMQPQGWPVKGNAQASFPTVSTTAITHLSVLLATKEKHGLKRQSQLRAALGDRTWQVKMKPGGREGRRQEPPQDSGASDLAKLEHLHPNLKSAEATRCWNFEKGCPRKKGCAGLSLAQQN